jgi:hypothetical protein
MSRHHYFHTDRGGHSITVSVRSGRAHEVELLVDGKEVVHRNPHGAGTTVVAAELPDDPPHPFRILVHQPRFGSGVPRCSIVLDGVEMPMAERAFV